jgi:hypothetical protein
MPRPKRDEILRHETFDEEEGFVNVRESTVVAVPQASKRGKGKRSTEDMLMSMPNDVAKCAYALERIASLEDQIAKVLELCTPKARAMVLEQRSSLKRYAPQEEED